MGKQDQLFPHSTDELAARRGESSGDIPLHQLAQSRRQILRLFAGIGLGMLVKSDTQNDEQNDGNGNIDAPPTTAINPPIQHSTENPPQTEPTPASPTVQQSSASHLETFIESVLMIIAKKIAMHVCNQFGIITDVKSPREHNKLLQKIREAPIETYIASGVFIPLVEELQFRLAPSLIVRDSASGTIVGVSSAVLFAYNHVDEKYFGITQVLPISQFMGGLFYWYLIRERGFDHSVLAHATNNVVAITGVLLS